MNLFIALLAVSAYTVDGLHPELRNAIRRFYEDSDFRTVMDLYNNYTENDDSDKTDPCQMHAQMEVSLDPLEFTSVKRNVLTSLNLNMALTFDGHINFSIAAILECSVWNGDHNVFEFFVLILPKNCHEFNKKKYDFMPVYVYANTENWRLFAVKDVYDFQMFRNTFPDTARDQLRIRSLFEHRWITEIIDDAVKSANYDDIDVIDWKLHFDNFILLLDEESKVKIPVITVIKLWAREINTTFYWYMATLCKTPGIDWPKHPFQYPSKSRKSKKIVLYTIHNTGETVEGMWAFCFDFSLVNPKSNAYQKPPFITKIGW